MSRYLSMNRYHEATAVSYDGEEAVRAFADKLIEENAHRDPGMDVGGASVWHVLFGGADHRDEVWRNAFNYARRTPEYATYLAAEMNGSMFDDSWGDVDERSGPSFMASAFANYMADHVLRLLGQKACEDANEKAMQGAQPACRRCASPLVGDRCPDETCPYSDHPQELSYEELTAGDG